jgi:hypothetical protein
LTEQDNGFKAGYAFAIGRVLDMIEEMAEGMKLVVAEGIAEGAIAADEIPTMKVLLQGYTDAAEDLTTLVKKLANMDTTEV